MHRRHLLSLPLGLVPAVPAQATAVQRGQRLSFPRDHGAHLQARTEWWYLTGWLGTPAAPTHGFQLTFFRSRTGLPEVPGSRFSAPQLLFAHAAVTDLAAGTHTHAQQLARYAGQPGPLAAASEADTELRLGPWALQRRQEAALSRYDARLATPSQRLNLQLQATQPPLLQGEDGWSQKGAQGQASHYVTEAPLLLRGTLQEGRTARQVQGTAWLDHEWSDELLAPGVQGWDWIGMNLFDGSSLTAFQLRRADGTAAWAGGSRRTPDGGTQAFGPAQVQWQQPARHWASPASRANYPLQWTLATPAGTFQVRALLAAQEIDSRASTGAFYWEGLSELLDAGGRRVGLGFLEMTGYAGALALGQR